MPSKSYERMTDAYGNTFYVSKAPVSHNTSQSPILHQNDDTTANSLMELSILTHRCTELQKEYNRQLAEQSVMSAKLASVRCDLDLERQAHTRTKRIAITVFVAVLIVSIAVAFIVKGISYRDGLSDGAALSSSSSASSSSNESIKTTTGFSGNSSGKATPVTESYIGNKKTKKYHRSSCSYLPDRKNRISFDRTEDAEDAGYEPCAKCKP